MKLEELEVVIKARIDDFQKKFKQASRGVTDFSRDVKAGMDATKGSTDAATSDIDRSFAKMQQTVARAKQDFEKFNKLKLQGGNSAELNRTMADYNVKATEVRNAMAKLKQETADMDTEYVRNRDDLADLSKSMKSTQARVKELTESVEIFGNNKLRKELAAEQGVLKKYQNAIAEITKRQHVITVRTQYINGKLPQMEKLTQQVPQRQTIGQRVSGFTSGFGERIGQSRIAETIRYSTAFQQLAGAGRVANAGLRLASSGASLAASAGSRLVWGFQRARQAVSAVTGRLPSFNSSISRTSREMKNASNSGGEFSRQLKQMPAQFLLYGLGFTALMKLSQGLWTALKANSQFANSFNQIRANLATAFYPIYQAIMPALNVLMQGLATVTGYLASFIAMLFGTSVSAAQAGAQGLSDSMAAIDGNGTAADNTAKKIKKLQQTLAGFDQINTLSSQSDDDDDADSGTTNPGGIDWGAVQTPSTPKWLTDFTKAFKDEMAKLFDPIKEAWNAKGKAVMDAWKYATDQVWQAVKNVAGSFEEVWTNGTGEKTMEQLFQLLANILGIIGDIGAAFNRAWTNGDAGTKMIQAWFDALNKVLGAVNDIAQSWRDAWNNGNGETLFTHLISIGTNLANIIGGFADQFDKAWKSGGNGTKIFDSLMGLANDFLGMVDDITGSLAKWATNLNLVPLMTSLSKAIGGIRDAFQPIWDIVTKIFTNVLLPAFKALIENLLPPILNLIGNLGDLFSALYKPLSPLVDWLTKAFGAAIQQNFKDAGKFVQAFSDVVGGIADIVKKVVSGFSDFFTNVDKGFDDFKASIKKKWDDITGWFGDLKNNTFEGVVNLTHKAVDTVQTAWNGVISIVNKMKTAFNNAWTKTKERTIAVYNRLKKAFNSVWNKTVNRTIAVYNRLKKAFNSRWAKTVNRTIAVYNRLKNTVKTAWKGTLSLASKVTGFAKAIRDAFASAGGKIAKFFGFKKGTQNFAGGMALVNDAGNANWRESYQEPGGPIKLLPNQKNLVTTFRRGTKIFTGEQTKRMQAKGILPKFAGGIGNGQMDDLLGLLDKFANIGNLAVPNLPTPQLSMAGVGTQQVEVADQQGFANVIATAIVTAVQSANKSNNDNNQSVVLEVDGRELAKTVIKLINQDTKITGRLGLKI